MTHPKDRSPMNRSSNKRGCLDLDCNLVACWHFDQSLKTGWEEISFCFTQYLQYYLEKTLYSTGKHTHITCAGNHLSMMGTLIVTDKIGWKKGGNLNKRAELFWTNVKRWSTCPLPLSLTAVLLCWVCIRQSHFSHFKFQWSSMN